MERGGSIMIDIMIDMMSIMCRTQKDSKKYLSDITAPPFLLDCLFNPIFLITFNIKSYSSKKTKQAQHRDAIGSKSPMRTTL